MNRLPSPPLATIYRCLGLFTALAMAACGGRRSADRSSITVFNAGALALPLRQALDSFAPRHGLTVSQESAGSIESTRKLTDLGRVPDVLALADTALFSKLLPGRLDGPVAVLGRSRLVLAYTSRSRFAPEVTPQNWTDLTTRPGVQVGRSDPALDPAGYRALLAMQLAERYYRQPGLARRLEAAAPAADMRPKSADLVALLQTGNLDYAWEYESVARRLGLRFIALPKEVDLGDPALAATYAEATVHIPLPGPAADRDARRRGPRSLVMHGAPIVFGAAVPRGAPNAAAGASFITYLMSPQGRAIFADYGLRGPIRTGAADTPRGGK